MWVARYLINYTTSTKAMLNFWNWNSEIKLEFFSFISNSSVIGSFNFWFLSYQNFLHKFLSSKKRKRKILGAGVYRSLTVEFSTFSSHHRPYFCERSSTLAWRASICCLCVMSGALGVSLSRHLHRDRHCMINFLSSVACFHPMGLFHKIWESLQWQTMHFH